MSVPDQQIISFLRSQKVLTLATFSDGCVRCAICFYAYYEEENALLFKSKRTTRHVRDLLKNLAVAGAISTSGESLLGNKGVQFEGACKQVDGGLAAERYYGKFPVARVIPGDIWMVALTALRFTDNSLGFGSRLVWRQD